MSVAFVGSLAVATAVIAGALAVLSTGAHAPVVGHPDASPLADAGWRGGLARWESLRAAATVACAAVCVATGSPLVLAIGAAIAPSLWIRVRADGARDRARRAFARLMAATEGGVRSGLSLPEALRRAAEACDDRLASRPIVRALAAFDLGAGLDESLLATESACHRSTRVALRSTALAIAHGLPRERVADLLASVVDRAGFEERLEDEMRASTSGARQQQWLLAAVVPALALYLAVTIPSLGQTLGSDLGRFVLIPAAAALELAGIVLGRHFLRSVAG